MNFTDFSDVEVVTTGPIPEGSIMKVELSIKNGNHIDEALGLTDGCPTLSKSGKSVYLDCIFKVVDANPYKGRKFFSKIVIYSTEYENRYGKYGMSTIKKILCYDRKIDINDTSEHAKNLLKINNFRDLEAVIFNAKIGIEKNPLSNAKFDQNVLLDVVLSPQLDDSIQF